MTVRLRLTLWYTALVTVIVAAFAGIVYVAVDRQLAGDLDHAVELRAIEVAQSLATVPIGRTIDTLEPLRVATDSALADQQHYIKVLNRQGRIVLTSGPLALLLPVSRETLDAILNGQVTREVVTISGGQHVALYGTPLLQENNVVGVVLVGAPLDPLERTLAGLRAVLVAAVLGTMVVAGGIGWLLATAAMRPVDSITALARAIGGSGDLSKRLPPPRRRDELGRLAIAFNELLERLDAALTQQRRFLADASHELRTPLTTIRANAGALLRARERPVLAVSGDPTPQPPPHRDGEGETLKSAPPLHRSGEGAGGWGFSEPMDDAIRAIAEESERMGRLVSDLLALARADAGQPLAQRPLMLDTLLIDVYQQARHQATHLKLTIGELEQVEVLGDPDRLRQVLLNLVDNACRYTEAGGTVTLSLEQRDGFARLAVADTGPGIGPDDLPHVFERFYRADTARTRAAGGTGLGLAISQVIAEGHGGHIEVESELGHGSTFTLVLPVAAQGAAASEERADPGVLTRL
ncbi:MAG: ATP-binding protein [Chloroflexota bacterium]